MLLQCDHCEAMVDAKVIAEHAFNYEITWDTGDTEDEIIVNATAALAVCPRCNHPMLTYTDDTREEGDFLRL